MTDWDLEYFRSKDWDTVQTRLDELEKQRIEICPARENLFANLDLLPLEKVKVVIVGQDPYPNPEFATGVAFSVRRTTPKAKWPPTLTNLFREYVSDLDYEPPMTGCLEAWAKQGVLLHNAIPSCEAWKSWSHGHWSEWHGYTKEIIEKLSVQGVPMVFLGNKAREWSKYVDLENSWAYTYSHPSPRASRRARNPFFGSRMFSTINGQLCSEGQSPIDWRL
jgi:uracil-DNA glycosylase